MHEAGANTAAPAVPPPRFPPRAPPGDTMRVVAPDVAYVWRQSQASGPVLVATALYNLSLGTVLILGGWARVDGPSFAVVREYGGPYFWGSFYVLCGLALAAAPIIGRVFIRNTYRTVGVVHLLLAASFFTTALGHGAPSVTGGHIAYTGIPSYLWIAGIHLMCPLAYRISEPPSDSEEADAA